MGRFNRRQGLLISVMVHLMLLTALRNRPVAPRAAEGLSSRASPPPRTLPVFLPPKEILQRLAQPRDVATTPEWPKRAKQRISIGPASTQRRKEPLLLRPDENLSAGLRGAMGGASPAPTPGPASESRAREAVDGRQGAVSLRGEAAAGPSIASSLRSLERRLGEMDNGGPGPGTGRQMGPLFFDPEGADFTAWVNHFKNEVYRNWIVPQAALFGFRGHVDFEFSVERNGSLTALRVLKSSGTPALDRAARNALLGSRLLALPSDFGPPRVTMQVTFFYNESPQGS